MEYYRYLFTKIWNQYFVKNNKILLTFFTNQEKLRHICVGDSDCLSVESLEEPQAEGVGVVRSLLSHSFSPEIFVVAGNSHDMAWFYLGIV